MDQFSMLMHCGGCIMTLTFSNMILPWLCRGRRSILPGCVVLVLFQCVAPTALYAHVQTGDEARRVPRRQIREAIRLETHKGYDHTATTNGGRFQGEVLLQLVRWAREHDPEGTPLFIDHEDIFQAYLEVTGLTRETAPAYIRLAHAYKKDLLLEYRTDRVIQAIEEGSQPEIAVNVRAWWPDTPGAPAKFSYRDTLSSPRLTVTNKRVTTFRLLDFGDMLLYDDIQGVYGRPTSGLLGLLFDLIGEGQVRQSRIAISEDGLQITYSRAEKRFVHIDETVVIFPDGRAEKDIPQDRPDLAAIEARLKQPLQIHYMPFE